MASIVRSKRRNVLLLCIIISLPNVLYLYITCCSGPCGVRVLHKLAIAIYGPTKDVPVFVTGGDARSYSISKQFIENLYREQQSRYGDIQLIYIDLGLTSDQIMDLSQFCGPCECHLKQIPQLNTFLNALNVEQGFIEAMIMKALWDEIPCFMWIDSSIKLNSTVALTDIFERVQDNGIQIAVDTGLIGDQFGLRQDHFTLLGENPMFYKNRKRLDTSWYIIGQLDPRTNAILIEYLQCVERSICATYNIGAVCESQQKEFSIKQCQAILALRLSKEFDDCYRSFSFSPEPYMEFDSMRTCRQRQK